MTMENTVLENTLALDTSISVTVLPRPAGGVVSSRVL